MNAFSFQRIARTRGDAIIRRGAGLCAGMLLVVCVVSLALAGSALAAAQTVLATGQLQQIAPADLIFRVVDLTLDPSDQVVTHKHGAGMTYAINGPHVLTVDGKATKLGPGQAGWIGDQVTHSHATDGSSQTHFLFMYLWPASQKGAPMAPGFRDSKIAFESDVLSFANRQAKDVLLVDTVLAAGQDSGTQSYAGPTLLSVQSGKFTVKIGDTSRGMQAGDFAMVQASTAVQLKSDAAGHVLALSVLPAGQPQLLPQTGSVDSPAAPYVIPALLGLALLALGWAIQRRRSSAR
jgi:MYXO-CTERM domain-containing protein